MGKDGPSFESRADEKEGVERIVARLVTDKTTPLLKDR